MDWKGGGGKRMFPDLLHYTGTSLEEERKLIRP
jgi:hypothetical protein